LEITRVSRAYNRAVGVLRGLLVFGIALLGGCLSVDYTLCGDVYCAAGEVCAPDNAQCVFPEQIESCSGQADGTFCTYSGVPIGACASGVCLSQTTGTLAAPETFAATDGSSTEYVELTWAAVDGATGYRVWRDSIALTDVDTTTFQDTGATAGAVPTAPGSLTASQATSLTDVELGWSASTSADGTTHTYFVTALASSVQSPPSPNDTGYRGAYPLTGYEVSLDAGTTFVPVGAVTAYTDTTAPVGTWTANVVASDNVAGKVTLAVSGITEVPAVRMYLVRAVSGAGTSASSVATGSRDVGNPTDYQWQFFEPSAGTYLNLDGATAATSDDTTGPVMTPRYYRCVLDGANGATAIIGPDDGTRGLEAPTDLVASDGTSSAQVALTWTAVYGATGYRVYRNGTQIVEVTTTSYDDTDAATSGGVPSTPTSLSASQGTLLTGVDLSWSASSSANGTAYTYRVKAIVGTTEGPASSTDTGFRLAYPVSSYEVSLDGGATFTDIGMVTAYADTTAPVGTWTASANASDGLTNKVGLTVSSISESFAARTYRVRAVNGAGSGNHATVSGFRDVGTPTGYQWQWSETSNGTYADLTGATTASYDYTTGPVITPQYFRCVLTGANGATATVGPDAGARSFAAPTGFVASDGTSSAHVALSWNAVYGATAYRVFQGTTQIAEVTATSYDDTDAPAGGGPNAIQGFHATDGGYTDRVQLSWSATSGSVGAMQNYTVAALAGTTQGPSSSSDNGYRSAFPITYELQINSGGYTNIGSVTSYADAAAPAGSYDPIVRASDGKAGVITLTVTSTGTAGATQSYALRAVNAVATTADTVDTGYRGVGTASYQWQRSAGASDASYSNISGATGMTYDDTTSYPTFEPRWYRCVVSGADATSSTSAPDPGWRGVGTTPADMWIAGGRSYTGVKASVIANGVLYIAGDFTYLGPKTGTFSKLSSAGVADTAWPKFAGNVNAAVSDGAGGWYAAGSINSVDGVATPVVVHVSAAGTVDSTFDPSINGTVNAIALSGGLVYIGGTFTNVGGQPRQNIAAVDATTGAVSLTWNPGASATVNALVVVGTKLYAGGVFTAFGGSVRGHLAAADLVTGAVDSWNPNANGDVAELGVSGTTIYIQGSTLTSVGGQLRTYVGAVDATTGLATAWNPSPNGFVQAILPVGGVVYVAGIFSQVGGGFRSRLVAVDATTGLLTSWTPPAFNYNVTELGVIGSTLYIGGGFSAADGTPRQNLAAVDTGTGALTSWNPGSMGWSTGGVMVSDGTSLFIGTNTQVTSVGGVTRNRLAAIDLTSGQPTSFNPDVTTGTSPGIYALAISSDNATLYLAGEFGLVGGQVRNRIASVNASTGAVTSWNPNANDTVRTLAVNGSTIYAGGDFVTIGGQTRSKIAALSSSTGLATAWDPIADTTVRTIAVVGSTVYAGGNFTSIGGEIRSHIVALDASTAAPLVGWDPGADQVVNTIVPVGSNVFVGGGFNTIGGQSHPHLAQLDGATGIPTSWSGTTSSTLGSFAVSGNAVFYCGSDGASVKDLIAPVATPYWSVSAPASSSCSIQVDGSRVYVTGNGDGLKAFDP
jgi:hypothetical protein